MHCTHTPQNRTANDELTNLEKPFLNNNSRDWSSSSIKVSFDDGTLGYPSTTSMNGTPDLVVADRFNADGVIDLAVVDSGADRLLIMLGQPSGGFIGGTFITTGDSPAALRCGDLDADGILDLVMVNTFSADIQILWGNEYVP